MDNEEVQGVKFSEFPNATPGDSDVVVGLHNNDNASFSVANFILAIRQGLANIFVPLARTINGKALSSDITLDASDVGAVDTADVGVADGVASLGSNGKVPGTQLDLDGKQDTITASGILKGDGSGGVSAATAGTDYQAPLTAGTDYATPAQLSDKANQSQLAYVETGTTASQNYTAGQYISLNGLLYTADTAIASGATFYTSGGNKNLSECVGGGFNNLAFPTERTTSFTSNNYTVDCYRYGYVGEIRVYRNAAAGADITLDTQLPTWARPLHDALTQRSYGDNSGFIQIAKNGNVRVKQNSGTGWFSATICYLTDPTT